MSDPGSNGGTPTLAVSRAMLAASRGRKKLDVVLSAPDPRAFVRRLPAEDLYFAMLEIGLDDSAEIVGLASPGQFRSFVDLDAWDRGEPDPQQVLHWLELAAEGARSDTGYRSKRAGLDPEMVLIVLKAYTIVHALEEEEDPVISSSNYVRTAEGKYIIEITEEGAVGASMRRLIEDFIDESPFIATRLFESVRWESKSELEETALRWRTGRLRDMGFPELEESLRIWAPLPSGWKPQPVQVQPGPVAGVPALLLVASRAPLFLDRVVERLPDEDRPAFNEGLIYLLNCALVADGIEPKRLELARETLTASRDMLSLGLELASEGDEVAALSLLGATPPTELFRFAVGRLQALSLQCAQAVKPVSFGMVGATAMDSPDAEIISGLRRKRPRLYDPPEPGGRPKPGGDWRPFRSRGDLAAAELVIQRARAAGAALHAIGLDTGTVSALAEASGRAVSAVTVSQLLLTAALDGSVPARPVRAEAVAALCQLFDAGRLTASARERFESLFTGIAPRLDADLRQAFAGVAAAALTRFEEEIGSPCAAGELDPRFVECILVGPPQAPSSGAVDDATSPPVV